MSSFERILFSVEAMSLPYSSSLLLSLELVLLEPAAEVLLASLIRFETIMTLAILGSIPPVLFFLLISPPLSYSSSSFYLGQ